MVVQKEIQSETDKDGNGLIDLTKYGTVVGWRMKRRTKTTDDYKRNRVTVWRSRLNTQILKLNQRYR